MAKKKSRGRPKGSVNKKPAEKKKARGRPKKETVGKEKKKLKIPMGKMRGPSDFKFLVVQHDGDESTRAYRSKEDAIISASDYASIYGCGYDLYSVQKVQSVTELEALKEYHKKSLEDAKGKKHGKN